MCFTVHHPPAEFERPGWLQPLAIAVAVGGHRAGVGRRTSAAPSTPSGSPRRSARFAAAAHARFWIDGALRRRLPRRFLGFSRVIGWLDRYIVDGVVNLLSAWTLEAGDRLRRIQSGQPRTTCTAWPSACCS